MQVSGVFLTGICINGKLPTIEVTEGLPEGTKFAYAIPDMTYGIWMVVEHESFPELKDGEIIPVIHSPLYRRIEE